MNAASRRAIAAAVRPLVGLRLVRSHAVADLRVFSFDRAMSAVLPSCALHVQCPWRIVGPGGVVTGRAAGFAELPPPWARGRCTEQDRAMIDLLGTLDELRGVACDASGRFVIRAVRVGAFGDLAVSFANRYRLELFVDGPTGEEWRLLPPGRRRHVVVTSSGIER